MPKSRFFRVAVEGATTDGRAIDARWLQEMADTYNPATYAARVNMEHIRGITADPPFQSLGDVLSVKTEVIDLEIGGKTERRLALFAEIDALEPLLEMNARKQKLYSSIEISPNFANTGKAYLVGLAVTDSPASLGTEMLVFCQSQGSNSPLAARKQDPANLFSAAMETSIELAEPAAASADPAASGLFASIKALVDKLTTAPATPPSPEPAAAPSPPPSHGSSGEPGAMAVMATVLGQLASTIDQFIRATSASTASLQADVAALKASVEATPQSGFNPRPAATGGEGRNRTDC